MLAWGPEGVRRGSGGGPDLVGVSLTALGYLSRRPASRLAVRGARAPRSREGFLSPRIKGPSDPRSADRPSLRAFSLPCCCCCYCCCCCFV
eukprot:875198-Prorocentrum_minimum.AAC.3